MAVTELKPEHFRTYPEAARELCTSHLSVLNRLPVSFAALLLREVISYDWKFPVERAEVDSDFAFLESLPEAEIEVLMRPFASVASAPPDPQAWVSDPVGFSEKLSAQLWKAHRIDDFRAAAVRYMDRRTAATPKRRLPVPRLTVVFAGKGVEQTDREVFRRLRPLGTAFRIAGAEAAFSDVLACMKRRSAEHPEPYAHWYIDGDRIDKNPGELACIAYGGLAKQRAMLQRELARLFEQRAGSEAMRSQLARKRPEELGLRSAGPGAILDRFVLSVLTEGSGTQIYSTTFVQWAAREALRRAQPLSLFVRFTPRQREQPMQELLRETERPAELDPLGSLVDAEMGAYYTRLNEQRLAGADEARFVAWFEGHEQAVAIAPSLAPGATASDPVTMRELLGRI